MILFKIIFGLLIGTYYLVWGMSVMGIPLSMMMTYYNLTSSFQVASMCFASMLLMTSLTLLLIPKKLIKTAHTKNNHFKYGVVMMVLATMIAGLSCIPNIPNIRILFLS